MKVRRAIIVVALLSAIGSLSASGPIGIYGIVEKVVFEPDEKSPERIQVWGAFAYVDSARAGAGAVSPARSGYLYFALPELLPGVTPTSNIDTIKREWSDLKAVAGKGQAIGFGRWSYIASFESLQPDKRPTRPSVILRSVPAGGAETDLRVRPASEVPTSPATYQTDIGIVKLSEAGSHAAIVKALKAALKR